MPKMSGFTLIETAIVLIIAGVLVSGFFSIATLYLKRQKMDEADWRMKEVRLALTQFVADDPDISGVDGDAVRFPCPAPLTSAKDDPGHAVELCPTGTIAPGDNLGGVYVVAGADAGSLVLVGAIPADTLGISEDLMLDAYGNRMTYAVTYPLTLDDALLAEPIPRGQITILSDDDTTKTAHSDFFIVSHGADGSGSFTAEGVPNGNPCRSTLVAGGGDSQNCVWQTTNTAIFKDNPVFGFSTAPNDRFYDDLALYTLGEAEGWWEAADASGTDIRNRNIGSVRITNALGVRTADPEAPLDVNGKAFVRENLTVEGDLGVGTDNPASKLDVSGDIRAGNSGAACGPANKGAIRYKQYTPTADGMEFCSLAGEWRSFSTPSDCRTVLGNPTPYQSVATCAGDEFLVSGGGNCEVPADNTKIGYIHESRPVGNAWYTDCYAPTGIYIRDVGEESGPSVAPSNNVATSFAVCCKRTSPP